METITIQIKISENAKISKISNVMVIQMHNAQKCENTFKKTRLHLDYAVVSSV